MTAVLVIEDDGVIARAMGAHLRTSGFDVEWADDGTKGLRKLRFERPDVCVVDLMLPGLDGWGLIERARDEGLLTPILAVSARGNEHDKVATPSFPSRKARCCAGSMRRPGNSSACSRSDGGAMRARRASACTRAMNSAIPNGLAR